VFEINGMQFTLILDFPLFSCIDVGIA